MGSPDGIVEKRITQVPVAVIGNDAVLAALPAHPIQLAHACYLLGYSLVIPASWGDELVADLVLRALDERGRQPAVVCSCSFVRDRLLAGGRELASFLIDSVSPPVAVARYLRALHVGPRLHLTYVGGCDGGRDPIYDERMQPESLLARLAAAGIDVAEQPVLFDDVVPPDRRRHFSLPGGCPTPEALWDRQARWRLVESGEGDLTSELAERLMGHETIVVDVSVRLGCVCAGAGRAASPASARLAVMSLEPPRSPLPVLDPLDTAVGLAEARAGAARPALRVAADERHASSASGGAAEPDERGTGDAPAAAAIPSAPPAEVQDASDASAPSDAGTAAAPEAARSAHAPLSPGVQPQRRPPSRPRPPFGTRYRGSARRRGGRGDGDARVGDSRVRDFAWLLTSFLAGAAAAVGAWSAWYRGR
jgi:hypothetical protein